MYVRHHGIAQLYQCQSATALPVDNHTDTSHNGDKSGTATTKTAIRQNGDNHNGDNCGQNGDNCGQNGDNCGQNGDSA